MSTSSTSGGDLPESAPAAAVVPAVVPHPIVVQHGVVAPFDTTQEDWTRVFQLALCMQRHKSVCAPQIFVSNSLATKVAQNALCPSTRGIPYMGLNTAESDSSQRRAIERYLAQ